MIIKNLVKIANHLDKSGRFQSADSVDNIISKAMSVMDLGDFSDLNKTNITPEEAFSAGHFVAKHNQNAKGGDISIENDNGDVLEGVITKVYDKESEKYIPSLESDAKSSHKHGKSYMALPLLQKIHRLSGELCTMIDEGDAVDDWMETYISQMSKMIDDIHTKIFYKLKKDCK